jgi:hypothetical protein
MQAGAASRSGLSIRYFPDGTRNRHQIQAKSGRNRAKMVNLLTVPERVRRGGWPRPAPVWTLVAAGPLFSFKQQALARDPRSLVLVHIAISCFSKLDSAFPALSDFSINPRSGTVRGT